MYENIYFLTLQECVKISARLLKGNKSACINILNVNIYQTQSSTPKISNFEVKFIQITSKYLTQREIKYVFYKHYLLKYQTTSTKYI